MIDGWDKGPRDRSKRASRIDKAMDWIRRLGPRVVIEVRDLPGESAHDHGKTKGVVYADLCIGEGPDAHRLPLGPVLYGRAAPATACCPVSVPTIEDAMRLEEERGRAAVLELTQDLGAIDA